MGTRPSAGAADVVVIGAGHNGLACACYLARAGLAVTVLEAAPTPGGCIHTVDLPDGRGRLELGAYEHGGIRGSGVADDLDLESRHGLRFHLRDEVTLAPCDDGAAVAFHASLDRTADGLAAVVGAADAEAYRRFAAWAAAAVALARQTEAGPPPTLRGLAALAETALGADGRRLVQALLASASTVLRGTFTDERLQGALAHWAAHSQQPPTDPGTGIGALLLAGGHGSPAARPAGGSRATVDAVERRVTGPADWVARHGNPNANPNHVEMSVDQLLAFRPSPSLAAYHTPIGGLFLTGAGTHPGGGVTGIPGRNAAAGVLEQLGVRRRGWRGRKLRERVALARDAARAARALRGSG